MPFLGNAAAVVALRELVTLQLVAAGLLMAIGVWLHFSEHHEHEHRHEVMAHTHPCKSARNRDPGRYDVKQWNERLNLQEEWGPSWAPMEIQQAMQFSLHLSNLMPTWGGVPVER